ncbi:MAG: hypothetical protein COA42_05080 [Alteromonadaceae bacterium]|nr:MAG: hypothetical protein COA42_05080 [Alteromonadaceae bacterium]
MKRNITACLMLALMVCSEAWALGAKTNLYSEKLTEISIDTQVNIFPLLALGRLTPAEVRRVTTELVSQIEALGYPVKSYPKSDIENIGYRILQVSFDVSKYSRAEDTYKSLIAKAGLPGIYVMPVVVKRRAKLKGALATWDGTNHTLQVKGGGGMPRWSGQKSGYSIKLEVFDANGVWLMNTYGGISMPVIAQMKDRSFIRKEDLFAKSKDNRALKRGIKKSLWPLKKRLKIKKKKNKKK